MKRTENNGMQRLSTSWTRLTIMVLLVAILPCQVAAIPRSGELQLHVVDADTGKPLACRIHLQNERGRPRKVPKKPFLKDHFVFQSPIQLELREGNYTFEVECGPEYKTQTGHFKMDRGGTDSKTLYMQRFVNMADEGWYAGDLYVHRPAKDIDLLMEAEDLYLAQVITWSDRKNEWNRNRDQFADRETKNTDRHFTICGGRDTRKSGGIAIFPLSPGETKLPQTGFPASTGGAAAQYPPTLELAMAWRDREPVWIDAESPATRDLPLWVAHDLIDSVRLANHRYTRSGTAKKAINTFPRDPKQYPGANGLGHWCEDIYYRLLESGVRLPPTAGSGSGDVDNPLGHNRVYVYGGESFSPAEWWEGLREGRVIVTNGPLLRALVDGQPPGHIFQGKAGEILKLQPEVKLSLKERADYLEIVKNGRVVQAVNLKKGAGGKLPPLTFDESGWFLVRVRASSDNTHRFATTGPFYVEFNEPRVSRRAADFFGQWVATEANLLATEDPEMWGKMQRHYEQAEDFWKKKAAQSTKD